MYWLCLSAAFSFKKVKIVRVMFERSFQEQASDGRRAMMLTCASKCQKHRTIAPPKPLSHTKIHLLTHLYGCAHCCADAVSQGGASSTCT